MAYSKPLNGGVGETEEKERTINFRPANEPRQGGLRLFQRESLPIASPGQVSSPRSYGMGRGLGHLHPSQDRPGSTTEFGMPVALNSEESFHTGTPASQSALWKKENDLTSQMPIGAIPGAHSPLQQQYETEAAVASSGLRDTAQEIRGQDRHGLSVFGIPVTDMNGESQGPTGEVRGAIQQPLYASASLPTTGVRPATLMHQQRNQMAREGPLTFGNGAARGMRGSTPGAHSPLQQQYETEAAVASSVLRDTAQEIRGQDRPGPSVFGIPVTDMNGESQGPTGEVRGAIQQPLYASASLPTTGVRPATLMHQQRNQMAREGPLTFGNGAARGMRGSTGPRNGFLVVGAGSGFPGAGIGRPLPNYLPPRVQTPDLAPEQPFEFKKLVIPPITVQDEIPDGCICNRIAKVICQSCGDQMMNARARRKCAVHPKIVDQYSVDRCRTSGCHGEIMEVSPLYP